MVPTRGTSEQELARWNQQLRTSDVWQNFMRQLGYRYGGDVTRGERITLSDAQQRQLEQLLAQSGMRVPDGMHIDPAGNLNQKNRLLRNIGIGAAVGGGALTGLGLLGVGPLSGLGGAAASGGAAAANSGATAAGGGALASSSVPVGALMGGPAAIASQGVSGTVAGMGAGVAGAAGGGIGSALAGAGRSALQNLTSPQGMLSLAPVIAALANRGGGGDSSLGGDSNGLLHQAYQDARERNAAQMQRYERTDPLHQMVTQLAADRMPISSRRGVK